MQARDDGPVELVLDPLRDGCRLRRREHPGRRERELGRDGQHRGRADRLAQVAGGLDRCVGLRREHDEVGGAACVGVRRAGGADLDGCRGGALRVA